MVPLEPRDDLAGEGGKLLLGESGSGEIQGGGTLWRETGFWLTIAEGIQFPNLIFDVFYRWPSICETFSLPLLSSLAQVLLPRV